jgi:transcriptional regulator of acetoin/glycerol metabolism
VLLLYNWPGNVRELENVIFRACITAMGDFIDMGDLPEQPQRRGPSSGDREEWSPLSLDEIRKQHLQRALGMCKGNRLRVGIGRTTLYRYLKHDGYQETVRVGSATNGR